jgi:myo-inositol 2-dehydrogenase/D-chiro-inositol 1-dehydrogenase
MGMTLRLGILGAGYIGGVHVQVLASDARVQIVGVGDAAPARAEELAARVGATACSGPDAPARLLDLGIDAIYICVPNMQHACMARQALEAGIHVFLEKPFATTVEDARTLLEVARRARGLCQVGHSRRFAPVYQFARRALENGFVAYSADIKMNRGELQRPPWTADPQVTGGFLYETPIHQFDLVRWLLGEVAWVHALAARNCYSDFDDFAVLVALRDGRFCTLTTCAHTGWLFPFERWELHGEHRTLVIEELDRVALSHGLDAETEVHDYAQLTFAQKGGYAQEDRAFIDAILTGRPPPVTAEDGFRAVLLADAIYRSVREQRPVEVPQE